MSEPEEDFAALFEASTKAKRFERGQTIEGRIVAIRSEVAFVDVGGKGEAEIDLAELEALCKSELAGYKRPKRYEVRTELPKTATGKIQRFKLRDS